MKRRIIAWVALILFIVIVINILFIHIYVTESVIIFMFYFLFFFFVRNKGSFLYSAPKHPETESEIKIDYENTKPETDVITSDETKSRDIFKGK